MTRSNNTMLLAAFAMVFMVPCLAMEEKAIPVSDEDEGNQCDKDNKIASVCLACSALPFKVGVNLVDCCTVDSAFQFCNACVGDQQSCEQVMEEIETAREYPEDEDYYDIDDGVYDDSEYEPENPEIENALEGRNKRYGTLFMKSPKRYGSLFFGKRSPGKRYGRLYMGSGSYFGKRSPGKRYGRLYMGSGSYFGKRSPEKRYGRLYMGSGSYFGKRSSESSFDSDDYGDDERLAKRYGYIFGSPFKVGKRDDSELIEYAPPKRYGQLFIGGNKMFGKRDVDKRYGRLFVDNKGWFGKRASLDSDDISDMDKRYGRLFTGRRRGRYFG